VVLAREERPMGGWRLEMGAQILQASFNSGAVTTLILDRDDARSRLNIDLRTESLTLAPGQSLEMEQELRWCRA
jgi:hypothetical protein